MKGPCLYLLSDGDRCKIGIDNVDINVRLKQHRTTCPQIKNRIFGLYKRMCSY